MEDDLYYIDNMIDCINARLLELGIWDAHFVASSFYNPNPSFIQSIMYKNKSLSNLSSEELASIGRYIEAVKYIRNNYEETRTSSPTFETIINKVKQEPLPTTHYISWAIEKVFQSKENS